MLDTRLHFIDLATRPLRGKDAAHDLARGELMDRVAHATSAEGDDSLESAVVCLERKAPGVIWKHAGAGFATVALLWIVLAVVFTAAYHELGRLRVIREPREALEKRLVKGVDPGRKLFLLANTQGAEDREVVDWLMKATDRLPEDPADFEEVCNAVRRSGQGLPDRYQEHGRRIDPDNGLWCLIDTPSTLWVGASYVIHGRTSRPPMAPPRSKEFKKAVAMLEEAANAPRIESYVGPRIAERLRMIAPPEDLADVADGFNFVNRQRYSEPFGNTALRTWQGRAADLCDRDDSEGLRRWIALWEKTAIQALRTPVNRGTQYYCTYHLDNLAESLWQAAGKLHLTDEEARLKRVIDELDAIRSPGAAPASDARYRRAKFTKASFDYYGYGISLDAVTPQELEPGLRVEHAATDRFSAIAAAGVFGLLALLAVLEGWRRVAEVRGLAHGLMPLLRPVDFAWVIGLGVVLPLAWQVGMMRFTPLGCRDLTIEFGDAIPVMGRVGGFLIFSLCMILQTARWRLAKRGAFFGLRPSALWPGWVIAIVPALFIPLTGLARYWPDLDEEYLACACAVLGVPMLWLLWRAASLAFGPRNAALGGVMLCRMVLPVLVLASVVMLGSTLLLKWEEKTWVARDKISLPDPSGSGLSIMETREQQWMRERLLKVME